MLGVLRTTRFCGKTLTTQIFGGFISVWREPPPSGETTHKPTNVHHRHRIGVVAPPFGGGVRRAPARVAWFAGHGDANRPLQIYTNRNHTVIEVRTTKLTSEFTQKLYYILDRMKFVFYHFAPFIRSYLRARRTTRIHGMGIATKIRPRTAHHIVVSNVLHNADSPSGGSNKSYRAHSRVL